MDNRIFMILHIYESKKAEKIFFIYIENLKQYTLKIHNLIALKVSSYRKCYAK